MDWYDSDGGSMSVDDWNSPSERTLQYLAASTPEHEVANRILLIVHAMESDVTVTLPVHEGVAAYTLLWDSHHDDLNDAVLEHAPGTRLTVRGPSMQLLRAHDLA
jgi:glycogen operon protein